MSTQNLPSGLAVNISPAAGGSTICNLTITVTDAFANAARGAQPITVSLLADLSSTGLANAVAPSGGVVATTGTIQLTKSGGKAFDVYTDNTGKAVLQITDAGRTNYWVAVGESFLGIVTQQLTTQNYG